MKKCKNWLNIEENYSDKNPYIQQIDIPLCYASLNWHYRLHNINKMIYNFFWDNKPDKIACKLTIQTNLDGGLNMKNIATFIQALKITCMRTLFISDDQPSNSLRQQGDDQPWVKLFKATISPICKIFDLGQNYASTISKSITNLFWKETLLSWG